MRWGDTRVFVQARMSSARFPGKVLAPFRGRPLVAWVVDAAADALGRDRVVVATSDDTTDDPLAAYVPMLGVPCFRGVLDDVLGRFLACADEHPCRWILRVSADSPLLDPEELTMVAANAADALDLATTKPVDGPSPHGRNAELISVETLRRVATLDPSPEDREHVTGFFYRQPELFSIRRIALGPGRHPGMSLTVDTLDDLRRLEAAT